MPKLEQSPLLPAQQPTRLVPALLVLGLIGGGAFALGAQGRHDDKVPQRAQDLSANVVTFVPADDRDAVAAAVAALKVTGPQRDEIARAVTERRQRIGWIVFTDSMDPDGDTISVESSGLTQQIVLTKGWTPVAILAGGGPIHVTAIRDGVEGGITVAFATSAGIMPMRIMQPGEHIEVVP